MRRMLGIATFVALAFGPGSFAQQSGVTVPQTQSPPAAPAPQPPPAPPAVVTEFPTLAPGRTDPSGADEVELVAKPAAVISGELAWDENFVELRKIFTRIAASMAKANLKQGGRPIVIFLESDDTSFKFEAMVPIAEGSDLKATLDDGVKIGATPAGKSIRFAHKASYDEIDSTYEIINAYLDAKGISVKDAFIEEFLTDQPTSDDTATELHIYVQPK
jgi:effector-binding domain-containing protein